MLILDLKAQRQIAGLILRAAAAPLQRAAVERQIRQLQRGKSVALDVQRCVVMAEDYLVAFCFEDAPGWGLVRHLAVSRGKPSAAPHRAAVAMLLREFGMTCRIGEWPVWFEGVPGRGRAVHLIEPLTLFNSAGLPLAPQAVAMVEDEIVPAPPDELIDDEAA
jgi:hypothetical protein